MTKFEEEAIKEAKKSKVTAKYYEDGFTASDIGLNIKLGRATHNFPWLEFAKNWHSDEEFQTKENELKRLRKINHLYKKAKKNAERLAVDRGERLNQAQDELASLESQLQQQALPVVPEDVDKAIKYLKKHNTTTFSDFGDILTEKGFSWLNDFQFKDRRFGFGGLNNKLFILSHLAITGYDVEKPKLFYIALPKVFGLNDSTFVSKAESGIISEFTKGKDYALKLTEQEIKSIDERYWQFAVPVEDGE